MSTGIIPPTDDVTSMQPQTIGPKTGSLHGIIFSTDPDVDMRDICPHDMDLSVMDPSLLQKKTIEVLSRSMEEVQDNCMDEFDDKTLLEELAAETTFPSQDQSSEIIAEDITIEGILQDEVPSILEADVYDLIQLKTILKAFQSSELQAIMQENPDSEIVQQLNEEFEKTKDAEYQGENFSLLHDRKADCVFLFGEKAHVDIVWRDPEKHISGPLLKIVQEAKGRKKVFRVSEEQRKVIEAKAERQAKGFLRALRLAVQKERVQKMRKKGERDARIKEPVTYAKNENLVEKVLDGEEFEEAETALDKIVAEYPKEIEMEKRKMEEEVAHKINRCKKVAFRMQELYLQQKERDRQRDKNEIFNAQS